MNPVAPPTGMLATVTAPEVRERVERQDALLAPVLVDSYINLRDNVDRQESMLKSTYQPLTQSVGQIVAKQETGLAGIAQRLRQQVRALVEAGAAKLADLLPLLEDADDIDPICIDGVHPLPPDVAPQFIIPGVTNVILPGQAPPQAGPAPRQAPQAGTTARPAPAPAASPTPGRGRRAPGHPAQPARPVGGALGILNPPSGQGMTLPGSAPSGPPITPGLPGGERGGQGPARQAPAAAPPADAPGQPGGVNPAAPIALPGLAPFKGQPDRVPGLAPMPGQPAPAGVPAPRPAPGPFAPDDPKPIDDMAIDDKPVNQDEIDAILAAPEDGDIPEPDEPEPDGDVVIPKAAARKPCLWNPGSDDFCRQLEVMLVPLAQVGKLLRDTLKGIADAVALAKKFQAAATALAGKPAPIPFHLFQFVQPTKIARLALAAVRKTLGWEPWKYWTLVGLHGFKAFLRLLESANVSLNPGVGLTLSLKIDLAQYVQIVDWLINYLCPLGIPSQTQSMSLYLANEIDMTHLDCLWAMEGQTADVTSLIAKVSRTRPDINIEIRDWMRYRSNKIDLEKTLRTYGMTDIDEIQKVVRASEYRPGPADLVSFAIKDVYDPMKLGRKEMLAELNEQKGLRELMLSQGVGPFTIRTEAGEVRSYDSAEDYWLAHYKNAGVGQVYEMAHRLRPGRTSRYAMPGPDGRPVEPAPVTVQTIRQLLKEDDYNPIWRDRLAAISFRAISRLDIRRGYAAGAFGQPEGEGGFLKPQGKPPVADGVAEKELVEMYMDLGYTKTDANTMAWITAKTWVDSDLSHARAKVIRNACEMFWIGASPRGAALKVIKDTGLSWRAAESELSACEMAHRLGDIKAALKAARRLFLQGTVNARGLAVMLGRVGITADRVGDHVRRWTIEQQGHGREATAEQMCAWLAKGLIDLPTMQARLGTLGFSPADIVRIVRHCQLGIAAKGVAEATKRAKAQERVRAAAAKAVAAAQTKRDKAANARLAKMLAGRSDKNLIAWWRGKLISRRQIWDSLVLKGMLPADATRWVKTYLVPKAAPANARP